MSKRKQLKAVPPNGDEVVSLMLDRESRDRIRSLAFFAVLQPALRDLEDVEARDDSKVPAHAQRLRTAMDLFEQLGWQTETDQQEFQLAGPRAALIDFLTSMERDATSSLENAVGDLRYAGNEFCCREGHERAARSLNELHLVSELLVQAGARWREVARAAAKEPDWERVVRDHWGPAGGAVYDRLRYAHPFVSCRDLVGMTREALEEEGAIEAVAA